VVPKSKSVEHRGLAECFHWLKANSINQPYLFVGRIIKNFCGVKDKIIIVCNHAKNIQVGDHFLESDLTLYIEPNPIKKITRKEFKVGDRVVPSTPIRKGTVWEEAEKRGQPFLIITDIIHDKKDIWCTPSKFPSESGSWFKFSEVRRYVDQEPTNRFYIGQKVFPVSKSIGCPFSASIWEKAKRRGQKYLWVNQCDVKGKLVVYCSLHGDNKEWDMFVPQDLRPYVEDEIEIKPSVRVRKLPVWYTLPAPPPMGICTHRTSSDSPNFQNIPKQQPDYKGFYIFTMNYCNVETDCDRCFLDTVTNTVPERFCSGFDTCSQALANYAEMRFIKRTIE
jgi:hypothetical protein